VYRTNRKIVLVLRLITEKVRFVKHDLPGP